MIIVLDANVVIANPGLHGPQWTAITEAITAGRLTVVMPEFAVWESVAVMQRQRAATAARIRAQKRYSSRAVKEIIEQAAALAEHEALELDALIRGRLAAASVTIKASPSPPHDDLVRRAISRTRPFNGAGSGYRDALHWHFFLDTVERSWAAHDLVLVSDDRSAFGTGGNGGDTRLHSDLELDLGRVGVEFNDEGVPIDVTWVRKLSDVEIPGEFDPGMVNLRALLSFDEIGSFLASSLLAEEPIDVDPSNTPFGAAVVGAVITDLDEPVVTQAEARTYYESQRIAIDFVVEMSATYLGFGVDDSDGPFSAIRNLDASGDVRFEGRVDFDPYTRQFGEPAVRLLKRSEWMLTHNAGPELNS